MSKYYQLIFVLILNLAFGCKKAKTLENKRPNIIVVITDDQGMGDLSCMGNKVLKTPHIDQFYNKSTRFTEFHVSPTCAPTRAALMSGRHEFRTGVTHTILERERMALNIYTLPQVLQSAGYTNGLFGKWHLGDADAYLPQNRGFNEVLMHGSGGIGQVELGDFPPNKENPYFDNVLLHNETIVKTKGFCTDLFFGAALSWTKKQIDANKPYFTYISLNAPHGPFIAPEKYKKRFLDLGYDEVTAGRYGMIENIDDNFGRLMNQMNQWNALENTLIIFMTDNGAARLSGTLDGEKVLHHNAGLRGAKNSPYEGGSHVPFFWYWKGVLEEGRDIEGLTAHIDIYKTFTELVGAKLPKEMQPLEGRSLLPLITNHKESWKDRMLFTHCGRWPTGKVTETKYKKYAVRSQNWRLVNGDELYYITKDPGETKNLIDSNPEVVEKFKSSYNKWWEESLPLMVNENLEKVKEHPLHIKYNNQLKEYGIPEWSPELIQ